MVTTSPLEGETGEGKNQTKEEDSDKRGKVKSFMLKRMISAYYRLSEGFFDFLFLLLILNT